MKKALKVIGKVLMWTLAVVVVIVLALPLWIGPVVKGVANSVGPDYTGTAVHVGDFALNPYTGYFRIGDVQVENPEGYSEKDAFSLGSLTVELDPLSLLGDVIHIRSIQLKDVFVSYIDDEQGTNNVDRIVAKAAGNKEQGEMKDEGVEKIKEEGVGSKEEGEVVEIEQEKKVIIDFIEIDGVKAQYGVMPLTLPIKLTLRDIGKTGGGIALVDAGKEIYAKVLQGCGAVGDQLMKLGSMGLDLGSEGVDELKAGLEEIKNIEIDTDSLKDAGKALEDVGKDVRDNFINMFK